MNKRTILLIILIIFTAGAITLLLRRSYAPLHAAVKWISSTTPINLEAGLTSLETTLGSTITTNPLSILTAAGGITTVAGAAVKRLNDGKNNLQTQAANMQTMFNAQLGQKDLNIDSLQLKFDEALEMKEQHITNLDEALLGQGVKVSDLQQKLLDLQSAHNKTLEELHTATLERNEYAGQVAQAQKQTYH